jgi:hypothetical protein
MSQDTLQQMQAKIAAMETQLQERAIEAATSHLPFANNSCREATRDLIRAAIKKETDGSYSADNLPLDVYISQQQWIPGMLAEVPTGTTVNPGGPARREAAGSFDLDAINPKMTAEDKDKARAAISSELAKMNLNPMSSARGVRPL